MVEREKKMAVVLAVIIGVVLFSCTIASQFIYQKLLPQVHKVEAVWQEDGYKLPKNALYVSRNGNCIYGIEEKTDGYKTKYVLKEVLVTIIKEDGMHVIVQGIYNPEWTYAAGGDVALENEMEVKIVYGLICFFLIQYPYENNRQ